MTSSDFPIIFPTAPPYLLNGGQIHQKLYVLWGLGYLLALPFLFTCIWASAKSLWAQTFHLRLGNKASRRQLRAHRRESEWPGLYTKGKDCENWAASLALLRGEIANWWTGRYIRDSNLEDIVLDQLLPQHDDAELDAQLHETASRSTLQGGREDRGGAVRPCRL